ncbi:MAG: glycosyltransferase [Chitinivibrionales bacterium]|nr:glycosyltransferase [Chitinivibrionales bacterium]MBD3396584.1 glycosyltransferase [Chitinivibrionales bacterium]
MEASGTAPCFFSDGTKGNCHIKIAFFTKGLPSDRPNGVSCQVHRLANALVRRGHDLTCISFSSRPHDGEYGHVPLTFGTDSRLRRKFVPARAFASYPTAGFDILHYHGDDFLCAGSSRRVRTFYGSALQEARHARSLGRFLYQSLFYLFELFSCARRGAKVGISRVTCDALPCVKQHIPCGVPIDIYTPGGRKTETPSILFLGDLGSRKRGSLLVKAFFEQVRPAFPSSVLTIVGPERVSGDGIRYLGTVGESRLVEEYRATWVYCMPSSYEGFGVPAIEAMACGTAVVATENPGTREVLGNERYGLLTTPAALGRTLGQVLGDAGLRGHLQEEGRRLVHERYDISITARRYEDVYASMRMR